MLVSPYLNFFSLKLGITFLGCHRDYQYEDDRLSAHWDLSGDPCPVVAFNWTVHKYDGTVAAPSQGLPLGSKIMSVMITLCR